jgi:hypothetical protein
MGLLAALDALVELEALGAEGPLEAEELTGEGRLLTLLAASTAMAGVLS